MHSHRLASLAAVAALGLAAPASAVTLTFSTDADYDNNFVELPASGASTLSTFTFASSERAVRKTEVGAQTALYNTTATGGSGGTGGTSATGFDLFTDVTVSADMRVSALSTPSLGLWSRVNETASAGYLGLVNFTSGGQVRLRIFDSNSNPTTTAVGTSLFDQTFSTGSVTLDTATFYTVSFATVTTAPDTVSLSLTLSTVAGVEIASASIFDTTSPLLAAGQVGFRAASATLYIDNFSVVAAVPEPATYATLLGLFAAGSVACRRRRAG